LEEDPSVPLLPTGNAGSLAPLFSAMDFLSSLRRSGDTYPEARVLTKGTSSAVGILLRTLLPLAAEPLLLM
jgi:hypothetical protein